MGAGLNIGTALLSGLKGGFEGASAGREAQTQAYADSAEADALKNYRDRSLDVQEGDRLPMNAANRLLQMMLGTKEGDTYFQTAPRINQLSSILGSVQRHGTGQARDETARVKIKSDASKPRGAKPKAFQGGDLLKKAKAAAVSQMKLETGEGVDTFDREQVNTYNAMVETILLNDIRAHNNQAGLPEEMKFPEDLGPSLLHNAGQEETYYGWGDKEILPSVTIYDPFEGDVSEEDYKNSMEILANPSAPNIDEEILNSARRNKKIWENGLK